MSSKTCDHIIGFQYGHQYESFSGDIVMLSELKEYLKDLTNSDEIYSCDFCPNCGVALKSVIEKETLKIQEEQRAKEIREKKEKEEREKRFQEKFNSIMDLTKLNKLDMDKCYFVSFDNLSKYDKRDMIISGTPQSIGRTIASALQGKPLPDNFKFNKVVICPTVSEFYQACQNDNWELSEHKQSVSKIQENRKVTLDYSKEGIVYSTSFHLEEPDCKDYDRGSIVSFVEHFKIPLQLEAIKLK